MSSSDKVVMYILLGAGVFFIVTAGSEKDFLQGMAYLVGAMAVMLYSRYVKK